MMLAQGLWRLDLGMVNAYLVADEDGPTLVDAGTPWNDEAILAGLDEAGFRLRDVERVLVTHYDLDHVGSLGKLGADLDAPVRMGGWDARLLTGEARAPLTNHKGAMQRVAGFLVPTPGVPVEPVTDGAIVGGFGAVHTPGHTPGHMAYLHAELDALFVGDLVREDGGELQASGWRNSYDVRQVHHSIVDLAKRAGGVERVLPGHGEPILEGGGERLRELAASLT